MKVKPKMKVWCYFRSRTANTKWRFLCECFKKLEFLHWNPMCVLFVSWIVLDVSKAHLLWTSGWAFFSLLPAFPAAVFRASASRAAVFRAAVFHPAAFRGAAFLLAAFLLAAFRASVLHAAEFSAAAFHVAAISSSQESQWRQYGRTWSDLLMLEWTERHAGMFF